jgi:heterodisulfide reductase subunit A
MDVDMVVLATPLETQDGSKELAQMLKVPLGQEGFFLEAHVKLRPVEFSTDGIFLCGTCRGPADITESIEQAQAAASRASIPLDRGYVEAEAITSMVDEEKCTGCGTCEEICPYNAIQPDENNIARVIAAACKGCGSCGSVCPEQAITMQNYTNEQLLAETAAALQEVS